MNARINHHDDIFWLGRVPQGKSLAGSGEYDTNVLWVMMEHQGVDNQQMAQPTTSDFMANLAQVLLDT